MKRRASTWRAAALFAALALVAAACAGETAETTTTTTAPPQTTTTTAATTTTAGPSVLTDFGVTEEPCPDAVNPDNGCIYLGTLSDLTEGPFVALALPIVEAQKAFWKRVNEGGGIGGEYDVNIAEYIRDNKYLEDVQAAEYRAIEPNILALAQTLGTPTTLQTIPDFVEDGMYGAPASWWSGWAFIDNILESGTNYCFEAMNAVDWALTAVTPTSVMAVHYPGDYGGDYAAGVTVAAEANNLTFVADVETGPNRLVGNQEGVIAQILDPADPTKAVADVVFVAAGPLETAEIIGNVVGRILGAGGTPPIFIGASPTWNPGVLASAAGDAMEAVYFQSGPWGPWSTDTPGHQAMREALADLPPELLNDGATAGWVWSYPILALLEMAYDMGDLTRAGLAEAAAVLTSVDYEGMLPTQNYVGQPNDITLRQSLISRVDRESATGVSVVQDFFVGPTAAGYDFQEACQPVG